MNLQKYSVVKLKKLLLQNDKVLNKKGIKKNEIIERIQQEQENIGLFVNNLFNSTLFKLALVEAQKRKINKPSLGDIFKLIQEINSTAHEKDIKF